MGFFDKVLSIATDVVGIAAKFYGNPLGGMLSLFSGGGDSATNSAIDDIGGSGFGKLFSSFKGFLSKFFGSDDQYLDENAVPSLTCYLGQAQNSEQLAQMAQCVAQLRAEGRDDAAQVAQRNLAQLFARQQALNIARV